MTLVAAMTPTFGRLALQSFPPMTLAILRFGLSTLLFSLILHLWKKGNLTFAPEDKWRVIILGILCIPVNQFFFLEGLKLSAASHAGLIYGLGPVLVLIFAVISGLEKLDKHKLLGFSLSFIGILWLFIDSGVTLSADYMIGDSLLFFAVTSWSAYVAYSKPLLNRYGALKLTSGVFFYGMLIGFPIIFIDFHEFELSAITPISMWGYLYITLITSFIGYFLWNFILKRMEATKVSIMSNLSPILAVIFGVTFLNEPLTNGLIWGGILIISGILLVQFSKRPTA